MDRLQEMICKVVTAMKIRTFGRHINKGIKNIGRNGWMTFSAISAVTVTLLILGVFLLLALNVNHMIDVVENQVEITAELDYQVTQAQVDTIEQEMKNIDGVKTVQYVSKAEGLQQLRKNFGDEAYLLDGLDNENPLNDIFIVKVYNPNSIDTIAKKITQMDQISYVDYGKVTVNKLFKVTKWIRNIGIIFIVGLAFTAMFLISNTIKMTIYARRREIEIMKLVGATNWFIRWPFFIEGLLLGIIGAATPIAILDVGYMLLLGQLSSRLSFSFIELLPLFPLVYQISILLLIIGSFIGIWGSMTSVRRFLKI